MKLRNTVSPVERNNVNFSVSTARFCSSPSRSSLDFRGRHLQIDAKYELIKPVGHGAYGVVISALNKETGQQVAIKKVSGAFEDLVDAKRILREITLLRKFDHDSVRTESCNSD